MNGWSYTQEPARYAKNCIAVRTLDGSGYKTPAGYLADAVGARYSHRERAYIMRAPQFKRYAKLRDDKRQADIFGKLID